MESTPREMRAKLPLLKGRVTDRTAVGFTIQLEGFRLQVSANMDLLDIRDGDIQTLYTEVLFKQKGIG